MAKSKYRSDGSSERMGQFLLKLSLAIDDESHKLDSAIATFRNAAPKVKQILEGRRLQQQAVIRAIDEVLTKQELDLIAHSHRGGTLH